MSGFSSIFRSFWGSLVGLIALLIILERAGGLSTILNSGTQFVSGTVGAFRANNDSTPAGTRPTASRRV